MLFFAGVSVRVRVGYVCLVLTGYVRCDSVRAVTIVFPLKSTFQLLFATASHLFRVHCLFFRFFALVFFHALFGLLSLGDSDEYGYKHGYYDCGNKQAQKNS